MKTRQEIGEGGYIFNNRRKFIYPPILVLLVFLSSCGTSLKLSKISKEKLSADIRLPSETEELKMELERSSSSEESPDTIKLIGPDGRELILMKAIKDEESGEMIAVDQIEAAYITARFRHVAERNGLLRLEFQLIVPEQMQDSKWQLRFHPQLSMLSDTLNLDDILITGDAYRKAQLRGYQQYEKFLRQIITDSAKLVDRRNLEIFLERNLPQLYAFKRDTAYVSDTDFRTAFGLNYDQVLEHYTRWMLIHRNNKLRRKSEDKKFKYIKSPIITEGVHLDTVIRGENGQFEYNYVQILKSRPKLKRIDLSISGSIFEEDKNIYNIPVTEPLSYYVSSVSSFTDDTPRYLTRVISKNVESHQSCIISFEVSSSRIKENMEDNLIEIGKIKNSLRELLVDESLEMDSIVVFASASPEGTLKSNLKLSYNRAKAVAAYFEQYLKELKDSLNREKGYFIDITEDTSEEKMVSRQRTIDFVSRSGGENWGLLDRLVLSDSIMSYEEKLSYSTLEEIMDLDQRETQLRKNTAYHHIRDELYPKLRTVNFAFHLHRKGMQKDTIHTTELDLKYMQGIQALQDQDYQSAIDYLLEYNDFNTALACLALDRNLTALSILEGCKESAKVLYLKSIVYSRQDSDQKAIEAYLKACDLDPSFIYRGNLDPEIALLKQKYQFDPQERDYL